MGSRGQVFQPTSPTWTLGDLIQISRQNLQTLGKWTRSLAQTLPNRTQVSRFPKIGKRLFRPTSQNGSPRSSTRPEGHPASSSSAFHIACRGISIRPPGWSAHTDASIATNPNSR